jgi:hypothetical protein
MTAGCPSVIPAEAFAKAGIEGLAMKQRPLDSGFSAAPSPGMTIFLMRRGGCWTTAARPSRARYASHLRMTAILMP